MKPTTAQDRMDILAELNETLRGTATEWSRKLAYVADADEGVLYGKTVRLNWQDDGSVIGSVIVSLDGEPVLQASVEITCSAVDYTNAQNLPTGVTLGRTWGTAPAGWFVLSPAGAWLEILATEWVGGGHHGVGQQHVTLSVGGKRGTWKRDPFAPISVRKGSLTGELDAALEALQPLNPAVQRSSFDGEPPW